MVQWLRICLAIQQIWVQSLIGELGSQVPWGNWAFMLQLLTLHTTTRESTLCNEKSYMIQQRCHMLQLRSNTSK